MCQLKESRVNQETGRSTCSLRRLEAETSQGYGWHEPYESRGSRTDLWETGGETPPVYPAVFTLTIKEWTTKTFRDAEESERPGVT